MEAALKGVAVALVATAFRLQTKSLGFMVHLRATCQITLFPDIGLVKVGNLKLTSSNTPV